MSTQTLIELRDVVSQCRACNADIIWVMTDGGKNIPCDPDLRRGEEVPGKPLITSAGEVLRAPKASHTGYLPHFQTCPATREIREAEERKPPATQCDLALVARDRKLDRPPRKR